MKNSTLLVLLFGAIALLLACTAQSRLEPLGRRLSQTDATASAGGTGDVVSTFTDTSGSSNEGEGAGGTTEMPTEMPTVTDGSSSGATATGTATTNTNTNTNTNTGGSRPCFWPWCNFNFPPHSFPHFPPHPPKPSPPPKSPPPPHHHPPPPPHHRPPHIRIPILRHKEVKVIIVPPKPVPQIPICKGKIKEACCDSKDYCPWNWWYYPDKEPPKICKVEVEVVKELKLCQWPVLVWKDEFDFTCKCPESKEPCDYCDSCYMQDSGYSSSSAYADSSSGYGSDSGGYAG